LRVGNLKLACRPAPEAATRTSGGVRNYACVTIRFVDAASPRGPLRNLAELQSPTRKNTKSQKGDDGACPPAATRGSSGHAAKVHMEPQAPPSRGLWRCQRKFVTQIRADYAFGHRAPSMSLSRLNSACNKAPSVLDAIRKRLATRRVPRRLCWQTRRYFHNYPYYRGYYGRLLFPLFFCDRQAFRVARLSISAVRKLNCPWNLLHRAGASRN